MEYKTLLRRGAAGICCLLLCGTCACTFQEEESSAPTLPVTTTTETTTETTTTTTAVTTATAIYKQDAAGTLSPADLLQDILNKATQQYGGAGMQVAVIADGRVAATASCGWAEKQVAAMIDTTLLRIASPSKTVVSMVAHCLIDRGLMTLDDDISQHLGYTVRHPSYPDTPITVRMLMAHTSALADNPHYLTTPEDLQAYLTGGGVFTGYAPGARFVYNNFAYGVLGTVCEYAGGASFHDLAQQYLFEPMGITASFLAESVPDQQLAVLYTAGGGVGLSKAAHRGLATYHTAPGYTMRCYAGGLIISAADYARLLTLMMNDGVYEGQTILSADAVASMHSVQFNRGAIRQCLPMWRRDKMYGQTPLYYHTGSAYGVYSLYVYNPTDRNGVVIVTTGSSGKRDGNAVYAVCSYVVQAVYDAGISLFGDTLV